MKAEADTLNTYIYLAPTEAARYIPGVSLYSGRVYVASSSAASIGNANQLLLLLGSLVKAIYFSVEAYR